MMSADDSQKPIDTKTVDDSDTSKKEEVGGAKNVKSKEKSTDVPKPATTTTKPATTTTKPATTTTKPAAAKKPTPSPRKPPTKAKKPDPPPPPEFEKGISDKITSKFGSDIVESTFIKPDRVGIKVGRENVHEVAEFIRDELNYDHVESVAGVDYAAENEIEVVYHIGSYTDDSLGNQIIALSTRAQREDDPIPGGDATRLPSLRDVFYSVEFHEREIFEMFGVYFEGHPDNRRLLLPEDWADLPPLRKDFSIKGR